MDYYNGPLDYLEWTTGATGLTQTAIKCQVQCRKSIGGATIDVHGRRMNVLSIVLLQQRLELGFCKTTAHI